MIAFAVIMCIAAIVETAIRDRCPRHTDVFDTMVCPLCSIRMSRQQEINLYCEMFEQGRNGSLFTWGS